MTIENDMAELKHRIKQLEKNYEGLKDDLEPIKEENIRQDEHYKQIMETLNEVKSDVKDLKNRPSKFLDYIYMTVMSALISFVISMMGR